MSKKNTFTPRQYEMEGVGFKIEMNRKIFKGTEKTKKKFLKTAIIVVAPFNGNAVAGKSKNPKTSRNTFDILETIGGGKTLKLTDMHGNGLKLRVV